MEAYDEPQQVAMRDASDTESTWRALRTSASPGDSSSQLIDYFAIAAVKMHPLLCPRAQRD